MASYHKTKNLIYDHVGKKAHKTEALKKKKGGVSEAFIKKRIKEVSEYDKRHPEPKTIAEELESERRNR